MINVENVSKSLCCTIGGCLKSRVMAGAFFSSRKGNVLPWWARRGAGKIDPDAGLIYRQLSDQRPDYGRRIWDCPLPRHHAR